MMIDLIESCYPAELLPMCFAPNEPNTQTEKHESWYGPLRLVSGRCQGQRPKRPVLDGKSVWVVVNRDDLRVVVVVDRAV